jgi:plasmid stability protein
MMTLTIRNVDAKLKERLRIRAARNEPHLLVPLHWP